MDSIARPLGNDGLGAERVEFMPQRFSTAVGAANEFRSPLIGPDKRRAEERHTYGIGPVEDRLRFERQRSALNALGFKAVRREFLSALRHPFLAIGQLIFCRLFLAPRRRCQHVNYEANQNRLTK